MKPLLVHLESATQYERIDNVASFIAEDDSGSFGIQPGHARLLTVLTTGLARFRLDTGPWEFIAVPGAVLYCHDNAVHVCARRYLRDSDYERIGTALREQLQAEERTLQQVRQRLQHLEEEMLKRLWRLQRQEETRA